MVIKEVSIVTARTNSRRFPNKTIKEIKNDLKSIDIVIERAKKIGYPVILATSTDPSDDVLAEIAKEHNVEILIVQKYMLHEQQLNLDLQTIGVLF